MNLILAEKEKIDFFSLENGELLLKYGKMGEIREEFKGYSFTPTQVCLICSGLTVMVYHSSFSPLYKDVNQVFEQLKGTKILANARIPDLGNAIVNMPDIVEVDMVTLHQMVEEQSGIKIQF
jgi:hypothetical protein